MDSVISFVRMIRTITEQLIRVICYEPDTAHAACSQQRRQQFIVVYFYFDCKLQNWHKTSIAHKIQLHRWIAMQETLCMWLKCIAVKWLDNFITVHFYCWYIRLAASWCYQHVFILPTELFDNYMQQDAHEFLNYLLNTIADLLQEEKSHERQQNGKVVQNGGSGSGGGGGSGSSTGEGETEEKTQQTWVHEIFQGTLTNETRCLNCEAVSVSEVPFFRVVTLKRSILAFINAIWDEGVFGSMFLSLWLWLISIWGIVWMWWEDSFQQCVMAKRSLLNVWGYVNNCFSWSEMSGCVMMTDYDFSGIKKMPLWF